MRVFLVITLILSTLFSSAAEEINTHSKLAQGWEKAKTILVSACADKKECLDQVFAFSKVVWENKDRRDLHKQLAFCSATVAYDKGYVLNPKKMWTEMNADLAKTTALEICICISNKWKNPSEVCSIISKKLIDPANNVIAISDAEAGSAE